MTSLHIRIWAHEQKPPKKCCPTLQANTKGGCSYFAKNIRNGLAFPLPYVLSSTAFTSCRSLSEWCGHDMLPLYMVASTPP